jgi:hypothetical protein
MEFHGLMGATAPTSNGWNGIPSEPTCSQTQERMLSKLQAFRPMLQLRFLTHKDSSFTSEIREQTDTLFPTHQVGEFISYASSTGKSDVLCVG